jgi:hypothetical protein
MLQNKFAAKKGALSMYEVVWAIIFATLGYVMGLGMAYLILAV